MFVVGWHTWSPMPESAESELTAAKPQRGITGNAMERAQAAMARIKAAREAREQANAERARARGAAGTGKLKSGRKRVDPRTRQAKLRTKRKAARDADRAERVARGEIEPKPIKRASGSNSPNQLTRHSNKTLIRELKASIPADQWERVLQAQPADSPGGKLLSVMSDLRMSSWSIERQCAEAGVKFQDLVRMVSDHSLGSALVASTRHVHEVVEGVAESAKSRMLVCELCLDLRDEPGEPTYILVAHPRELGTQLRVECPKCGGVGRVRKEGSPRAVETFLKLHGGLEEQQGPTVNVNTQLNFGSQHSMGVQRGQQLLEMGRQRRSQSASAPITVTATRIDAQNGASE